MFLSLLEMMTLSKAIKLLLVKELGSETVMSVV